jgi:membrane-anchored protein YejM (alkaline phosphatase superfamily)
LDTVLDRCYWTFNQSVAGELFSRLSSRQSTWQNARDGLPLAARMQRLWRNAPLNQSLSNDYQNLLYQGEALIQDPDIRVAFIHMPVPHPPGLYRNPTVTGPQAFDYLGNLILADQAMGQFLNVLATSPAAADTVLIVASDHSWRTTDWRAAPGWTKAEERASNGGQFDRRPVLMVHFPGEAAGESESIDRPQSAMIVHSLLLDMFAGKIRNPQELKDALNAEPLGTAASSWGE